MSRATPAFSNANRPASRRLHRRAATASGAGCALRPLGVPEVPSLVPPGAAARFIHALPADALRDGGGMALLAAELRIAELEAELAAARAAAATDPLTGALNRRGFDAACRREMARAQRKGGRLVFAHLDLDAFKQLNDRYGHQIGDQALVHLVRCIERSMRPGDVLCRFGGEEFVLMLPDTRIDDAVAAVQRHLALVSAQPVPGAECTLTFSAGVVCQQEGETLAETLRRADAATYVAKRSGRNRIERA